MARSGREKFARRVGLAESKRAGVCKDLTSDMFETGTDTDEGFLYKFADFTDKAKDKYYPAWKQEMRARELLIFYAEDLLLPVIDTFKFV